MDRNVFRQVLPERLEIVVYLIMSALALTAINVSVIIDRLSGQMISSQIASENSLGLLSGLSKIPLINTVVIVVFWGGVGLIAYTVVWAMINAGIEARNEIVVESEYANKGKVFDRIKAPLLKAGGIGALLLWLVLNRVWLGPLLLGYFHRVAAEGNGAALASLLVPIAVGAADIAVAVALFKLTSRSSEIIEGMKDSTNSL